MSNEREVFNEKNSSERGLEADPLRREKSAQEMRARELAAARQQLLCADRENRANETSELGGERLRAEERKRAAVKRVNETSEQREERLAAKRKRAAFGKSNETSQQRKDRLAGDCKRKVVKRSNETSEQREELLAADRKRAALKVSNERSKGREECSRAVRESAAGKRSKKTSQEKELRLRSRRERAALKRQSESPPEGVETNRRAQLRRASDTQTTKSAGCCSVLATCVRHRMIGMGIECSTLKDQHESHPPVSAYLVRHYTGDEAIEVDRPTRSHRSHH